MLFFDEYYQEHRDYRFEEVLVAAESAALVLFAGTSFSVGVTDLFLRSAAQRAAPCFSVDPQNPSELRHPTLAPIPEAAEELLPAVCRHLGAVRQQRTRGTL